MDRAGEGRERLEVLRRGERFEQLLGGVEGPGQQL